MFRDFIAFRKTDRPWHLAVLAGICVGLPTTVGFLSGAIASGKLASMAGLVILYLQPGTPLVNRMITLMACSFGLMVSFTIGLISAAYPFWSPAFLGLYAFIVHVSLFYLGMRRPPGNLFFVMLASIAICMPYDPATIPYKIGLVGIGTMISCLLGLVYSIVVARGTVPEPQTVTVIRNNYVNIIESATFGLFVGVSLLVGRLWNLPNPYWLPISSAAVMLGVNTKHIWQRSVQRVAGTLIGVVLMWVLLQFHPSPAAICVAIILLQILVEWLIGRNYGVGVIFLTMLTIFLAESGNTLATPNVLMRTRVIDIALGSLVGAIGGWALYNEKIRYAAVRQLRRTVLLARRK